MDEQGAQDSPVIYLHDIKRQYMQGEVPLTILDGAKLALWPGQSVALVAPSGSGKSTLLHIAGLLETPDEGAVRQPSGNGAGGVGVYARPKNRAAGGI